MQILIFNFNVYAGSVSIVCAIRLIFCNNAVIYFFEDALKFRKALHLPLIYVGGLVSRDKIEEVLNDGFEFVAMARALVNEPGFVNRMKEDEHARCDCGHSNYCIARMYSEDMVCHKNVKGLPECIVREIKRLEYK